MSEWGKIISDTLGYRLVCHGHFFVLTTFDDICDLLLLNRLLFKKLFCAPLQLPFYTTKKMLAVLKCLFIPSFLITSQEYFCLEFRQLSSAVSARQVRNHMLAQLARVLTVLKQRIFVYFMVENKGYRKVTSSRNPLGE